MPTPLIVAVIIGSTRQGRVGEAVGRWFTALARRREDLEVRLIDLADFQFPANFPDAPTAPMIRFAGLVGTA